MVTSEEEHGTLREQLRIRKAARGHVGGCVGTAPNPRPGPGHRGLGLHPMHSRGLVSTAIRQHTDGQAVMLVPIAAQSAAEGQDQVRAVAGPQKPRGCSADVSSSTTASSALCERCDVRLRRRRAAAG